MEALSASIDEARARRAPPGDRPSGHRTKGTARAKTAAKPAATPRTKKAAPKPRHKAS